MSVSCRGPSLFLSVAVSRRKVLRVCCPRLRCYRDQSTRVSVRVVWVRLPCRAAAPRQGRAVLVGSCCKARAASGLRSSFLSFRCQVLPPPMPTPRPSRRQDQRVVRVAAKTHRTPSPIPNVCCHFESFFDVRLRVRVSPRSPPTTKLEPQDLRHGTTRAPSRIRRRPFRFETKIIDPQRINPYS